MNQMDADNEKIFLRFRNINILVFAAAFFLMIAAMLTAFSGIINKVTCNDAARYTKSSADILSAHISQNLDIVSEAAHSDAIINWLLDEEDMEKKTLAFQTMLALVKDIQSHDFYIGVDKSLNQYIVDWDYSKEYMFSLDTLNENDPADELYFECVKSDKEYLLSIDIPLDQKRRQILLCYKITYKGVPIGVIFAGLDLSQIISEIFSLYDSENMRGIIINESGNIYMDSLALSQNDRLAGSSLLNINEALADNGVNAAIKPFLYNDDYYSDDIELSEVIKLVDSRYQYISIIPVKNTNWASIIIFNTLTLFNLSLFLPVFLLALFLLIVFAATINT